MTELDLGLKVGVRSLLWSMGFSTRLDVQLRGHDTPSGGAAQAFTDLDVLGVAVTAGYRLTTTIADCKSGGRDKPVARMFWTRGVADLFGADDAMLVRERDVNDATRQLSARLGVTVLPATDLAHMQTLHGEPVADDSPLNVLFDRAAVEAHLKAFTRLDRKLDPLIEYRDFDYWVYEKHRNPFQLVAHLSDVRKHMKARDPDHLGLFFDLVWLYLLSLIRVTEHVRGAFLDDPDRGIQEYLYGGPVGLKEKRQMAELLQAVRPKGAAERDHLPEYYPALRELVIRLMRRPNHMQAALRHVEAASALSIARERTDLPSAFGDNFDALAAKLVADVCGFLVSAAGLDGEFRTRSRAYLLAEPSPDIAEARATGRSGQASRVKEVATSGVPSAESGGSANLAAEPNPGSTSGAQQAELDL